MKHKDLIFALIMTAFCISCLNSKTFSDEKNFYLTLGSCFDNDTVSVIINDSVVLENTIPKSDFSTGIVLNIGISYENGQLVVRKEDQEKRISLYVGNNLKISVLRNGKKSVFDLNLNKGKYLVVDACEAEGVEINQYKKPVSFE